jgi:glycosyltransferase involved in cell wall biosynthesis
MNILMVCATDIWSMGDGRGAPTIHRTLKAFSQAGHTVHLVLPGRGRPPAGLPGVRFHGLPFLGSLTGRTPARSLAGRAWRKFTLAVLFPLIAAWRARAILRREPIDVLYGYEVQGTLAVRILRRFKRLPTVTRFQGTVLSAAGDGTLGRLRKLDHVLALKTRADLYIMTDDGTLGDETLIRLNRRAGKRMRFWRNGIDLSRFTPAPKSEAAAARKALGLPTRAPVVLASSRLVWWKRLDRVIRVWPRVTGQHKDALLLIAGDGDERANLEEMARRLGLADSVRFLGALPQEEIVNLLRAADIFVSVNDLSNAGNPLMEAAASAKAIVTLDNGSTGRLVQDGVTGRLLEPDDDEALAGALIGLIEDGRERRRLGEAAHAFAAASFWSWDQRMSAEVQAVSELVAAAGGGS